MYTSEIQRGQNKAQFKNNNSMRPKSHYWLIDKLLEAVQKPVTIYKPWAGNCDLCLIIATFIIWLSYLI